MKNAGQIVRPAMIRKLSRLEQSGPCRHLRCTDLRCDEAQRRSAESFEGDSGFGDYGDSAW